MAIDKLFSKKWLLSLSDNPPAKRTEYRDKEYKYLRCMVQPSGHTSLSVYKAPRGQQRAVRSVLDVRVDKFMPPISEVRSKAADKCREIDAGQARKQTVLTLGDAFKVMLDSASLKPGTQANYERGIYTQLKSWGDKPLTGDAADLLKMHRAVTRNYGPVAANTALRTVRRIMNVCRAHGLNAPEWPTGQLRVLRMWAPEEPRSKRRLGRDDFPTVWRAIQDMDPPYSDLMQFLLLTGCRRGEAVKLEVGDLNFSRRTLTFRDTKNKRDHTLPMTDTLKELLKRQVGKAKAGVVFKKNDTRGITNRLEKATGVHLSPHDCRRTFAGVAELAGVGSHTVSVLLNHKGGSVTASYIGELDNAALRQALEKIEQKMTSLAKA